MSLLAELSARVRLDTDFAVYRKKAGCRWLSSARATLSRAVQPTMKTGPRTRSEAEAGFPKDHAQARCQRGRLFEESHPSPATTAASCHINRACYCKLSATKRVSPSGLETSSTATFLPWVLS